MLRAKRKGGQIWLMVSRGTPQRAAPGEVAINLHGEDQRPRRGSAEADEN